MKKFLGLMLLCATTVCLTSCFGESSSSSRVEDDKYWESIGRERALRDAGMDGAANIERQLDAGGIRFDAVAAFRRLSDYAELKGDLLGVGGSRFHRDGMRLAHSPA